MIKILFVIVTVTVLGSLSIKCKHSCGNYIKLNPEDVLKAQITKSVIEVIKITSEPTVIGFIMRREKYWTINRRSFGTKPVSYGRKTLLPNKEEAIQWYANKKCKIGPLCAPQGDCWGASAEKCHSDEVTQWSEPRAFQYIGIQWTQLLNAACTMDWECSFFEKEFDVHYNFNGDKFIVIDDSKLVLTSKEPNQLHNSKTFNVLIPKMPLEVKKKISLECFKYKEELLCEELDGAYILFQKGTKCASLGNSVFCLMYGEFDVFRDLGSTVYASLEDLNQIRDAFIVNQERENYNIFVLDLKIKRIQDIIIKSLLSLTRNNPDTLNGILGNNFHSRLLQNDVIEVCYCEKPIDCKEKEFHSNNIIFCTNKNMNISTIYPFNVNKSLDYTLDEKFHFQGKTIHIEEAISEKEEEIKDFEENHPIGSFWDSLRGGFGLFSAINDILLYISLGLSIINFLRR